MRRISWRWILASVMLATLSLPACTASPKRPATPPMDPRRISQASLDPQQVESTVRRVADSALRTWQYPWRHWAMGPLYDGLIDASLVTGDPRYLAAVARAGNTVHWQPGPNVYHADDLVTGHAWLRIYMMSTPDRPEELDPFRARFDEILARPIEEPLSFTTDPKTAGVEKTDRWTWSDALYMGPPAFALMSLATGDRRYIRFADKEAAVAREVLLDKQENLFYRDSRFFDQRSPNGKKIFWSRGNGWVLAGIPMVLDALPMDYTKREEYVQLFQRVAGAVLQMQQPNGFWAMSLLDPAQVPQPETTGTALFVYGLAWGVRHGLLDQATYWPAVERGWRALQTQIGPDGAVTGAQPVGAQPEAFPPGNEEPYGHGAVLAAGTEILRALRAQADVDPQRLLAQALERWSQAPALSRQRPQEVAAAAGVADRAYSVRALVRIAEPVLVATSEGKLHQRLPIHSWEQDRTAWTHYEAFARTLAGIAPWLELGPDDSREGVVRARFIELARKSLINATDPRSPDYMNFGQVPDQPLVESAYLAYALLTAPKQLWEPLTAAQKENVLAALRMTRKIKFVHENNWYLFPAMAEAALWRLEGKADVARITTAVRNIENWYLGDGTYGDGPNFHYDYYNSYVIHPMLLMVLEVAESKGHPIARSLPLARERGQRYAEVLQRLISPEGTFPVLGRSSAYRFAAFFQLADMARKGQLPDSLDPGAVRRGMTVIVRRMVGAPGTFDQDGWLQLGAVGHQPGLEETYNATGSLYVALTGLVYLGLPPDHPFWTAPPADWTQRVIWSGRDAPRDHSLPSPAGNKQAR